MKTDLIGMTIGFILGLMVGLSIGPEVYTNDCRDQGYFVHYHQKYECVATGEWRDE